MGSKTEMLQALEADAQNQILLLQKFVQSASPNPPGQTAAAARILTAYLDSKGIPYELTDPQGNGQPNIVSDFVGGQGDDGPRVVLNGHIDVFPVEKESEKAGWIRDPWSGEVEGDRLHGRGVVDMKSGTASLVVAYASLYARRSQLRGSVALCAVSDEETGGRWGTRHLLQIDGHKDGEGGRSRWGGDVMLSAEPGGCGSVRFSEKGTLRLTCTVRTRGAHGAYTNLSKGAVRMAAAFIGDAVREIEAEDGSGSAPGLPDDLAKQLARPEVRRRIDEIMGPGTSDVIARPTVNIGTIHGGLKVNMIPDTCVCEMDIRLPPCGLARDDALATLRRIAARYIESNEEVHAIDFAVHEAASNPASYSPLSHPLVGLLILNAKQIQPEADEPLAIPSMGATDCKHYRYAGIPAYVYGCSPKTMAQVNESASINEFLHVTKVHAAAVWDFLQ